MILLDTDVVVDILREYPPAIAWLNSLSNEQVMLPGFVMMELIDGCRNKQEQERVKKALGTSVIVWPSHQTCNEALDVFLRYRLSHNLGVLDTLIGQTAVALNVPLYTFNQKHYLAIPNLNTVQPYNKRV